MVHREHVPGHYACMYLVFLHYPLLQYKYFPEKCMLHLAGTIEGGASTDQGGNSALPRTLSLPLFGLFG